MAKIIDWVCLNCFFIGRMSDRGILCCESPRRELADKYYKRKKEEFLRNRVVTEYVDLEWMLKNNFKGFIT